MLEVLKQEQDFRLGEQPQSPDVVLICQDGRILTHRVLLAATSRWLKQIFRISETDEGIQTVILNGLNTSDIIPTIDFLYGRKDSLQKEELNTDLLFDVFSSTFPFPADNKVKLENQNNERKVNSSDDTIAEADFDMLQVEIKQEDKESFLIEEELDDNERIEDDFIEHCEKEEIVTKNSTRSRVNKESGFAKWKLDEELEALKESTTDNESMEKHACDQCDKYFANVYSLNKHRKFIHFGVKAKCDLCEYETTKPYDLKIHRQRMHEGITYPCDRCEYKSKSKHHLKYHIKTKHEGFRLQCSDCSYKCIDHTGLRLHRQSVHENIKYPCKECNYVGSKSKDLYNHQKNCHMEKQLLCDECDIAFAKTSALKEHKQVQHEGVRFHCELCDYTTKARSSLRDHRKVKHWGIKIPCDVCGFMAWNNSQLKRHKESKHDGIKHYCELCEYTTNVQSNLTKHRKVSHEGQRYYCDLCSYNATTKDIVRRHKKKKHPDIEPLLQTQILIHKCVGSGGM